MFKRQAFFPWFLALAIVFLLVACAEITYEPDRSFLNSAQAGSFEYPMKVNGYLCQDMERVPGLCSKRLADNQALILSISPQLYAYRAQLTCSRDLGADRSVDVAKNEELTLRVEPERFGTLRSFTCIVEIFPADRAEELSAKAEVRVKLYDHRYVGRESMRINTVDGKRVLVTGANAKYSKVCLDDICTRHTEKTAVEIGAAARVFAYSESERMRFNYFWSP